MMKAVRPTAYHIYRLYESTVFETHPSFNTKHITTLETLRDLNNTYRKFRRESDFAQIGTAYFYGHTQRNLGEIQTPTQG